MAHKKKYGERMAWSKAEKEALLVYWQQYRDDKLSRQEILARFPGKNWRRLQAMHSLINRDGYVIKEVSKPLWSVDDKAKVMQMVPRLKDGSIQMDAVLEAFPGRTLDAIRAQYHHLNARNPRSRRTVQGNGNGHSKAGNGNGISIKIDTFQPSFRGVARRLAAKGMSLNVIREIIHGRQLNSSQINMIANTYRDYGRVVAEEVDGEVRISH